MGGGLLGFNVSKILRNFILAPEKACHCEDELSEDVAIAKSLSINEITTQSTIARNDKLRHAEFVSGSKMPDKCDVRSRNCVRDDRYSFNFFNTCHRALIARSVSRLHQRVAFTLAEVLITLGIIGVVASLTLPPLIQKHQKQVWVNQLKKSVSTLENGFKMMMADAETDDLLNTEFWQKLQELAGGFRDFTYSCVEPEVNFDANDKILKKYFKILSFGDTKNILSCSMVTREDVNLDEIESEDEASAYKILDPRNIFWLICLEARKIQMVDGTTVGLEGWAFAEKINDYNNEDIVGKISIDVNGKNKGPNQWGRDTFLFVISRKGVLLPYYSSDWTMSGRKLCGDIETGDLSGAYGVGCAKRIIEDGWKMNY